MRTIIILEEVEDPDKAADIIRAIQSLRNRMASVRGTMNDFADRLGEMLKISGAEVLAGLDTENGTVTIEDQTD